MVARDVFSLLSLSDELVGGVERLFCLLRWLLFCLLIKRRSSWVLRPRKTLLDVLLMKTDAVDIIVSKLKPSLACTSLALMRRDCPGAAEQGT